MKILPSHGKAALRIAGLYCLFGLLWVLLSDQAVYLLADGDPAFVRWQSLKGAVFVLLSGLLIHVLVLRELRTRKRTARSRRETEQALRKSEEKFYKAFQLSPLASAIMTLDGERTLEVNRGFVDFFGHPREEALAAGPLELGLWADPSERDRVMRIVRESGAARGIETTFVTRSGEEKDVIFFGERLELDGEACVLGTAYDITEQKAFERELERMALHDSLTDLPNRSLFRDRLGHALERARRHGGEVAVLFLDLDRFKVVNDTLGHTVGDELLAIVAERISGCFREQDTVARLGGDEFGGLLEDVSGREAARAAAARLIDAFDEPFRVGGTTVHVTASIGIAVSSADLSRSDDLLRFSDIAMYQAKESEGTGFRLFDPRRDARATQRLHRENDLRRGIEEDEFFLRYQPTVSLVDGTIRGAEALVRWDHPERGTVPPSEFVPLAEESGLIVPLGRWIMDRAVRQVVGWKEELPPERPFVLSVNLSGRQFHHARLHGEVSELLRDAGLPPSGLQLEITESVMMKGRSRIDHLRELGVRLAIDDFGTGYSSLEYLKHLRVDALKVDRTFVGGVGDDPRDSAILRAVFLVAGELGLSVTAEGIETERQLNFLQELGCRLGQGFYFSRPVAPEELADLLLGGALPLEGGGAMASAPS